MRRLILVPVLLLATACGAGAGDTTSASTAADGDAAFPVTIEHALRARPRSPRSRRAWSTWGWGSADAAIALGVVPVAIPFQAYGGDADGVLPWIREALEADGAEVPAVLPDAEEPPFEAIAAADPDLILAAYSGITETGVRRCSARSRRRSPTRARRGRRRGASSIEIVGTALGRTDAADAAARRHRRRRSPSRPTPTPSWTARPSPWCGTPRSTFYVYKPADPRVEFTLDLGPGQRAERRRAGAPTSRPSTSRSATSSSPELTSDILVSYADTPEASATFLASAPRPADGPGAPTAPWPRSSAPSSSPRCRRPPRCRSRGASTSTSACSQGRPSRRR